MADAPSKFVSRGGEKLAGALDHFPIHVTGMVCADLGSHVGGFVDCLLHRGASKVYSVDTSYGTLAWRLRKDPRVMVLERANAMHVSLPEPVDLVTVDVGWTRQEKVLPNVLRMLKISGAVLTLVKPHYEAANESLRNGVLPDDESAQVLARVLDQCRTMGFEVRGTVASPIRGHGGNLEYFAWLTARNERAAASPGKRPEGSRQCP